MMVYINEENYYGILRPIPKLEDEPKYKIPKDKLDWIMKVFDDFWEVQKYLRKVVRRY